MLSIQTGALRGLRGGVFSVVSVAAFLAHSAIPATAAPYSDIVVDANTGAILHQTNPDATRHPASLTKIMTLYLLFEQLEAGKIKLDSQLKVSQSASEQSPTKLGLKPGGTIQVEDAIKGIVTRSANDASVVVAEAIAGDEETFAAMMTRKAIALGMTKTIYKNASGLPNDQQITTARDQSILGRAIQERFPKYYKYFQTRSFTFRGQSIGNHNNLLGRVEGVDGIKTGYIRASGFNLVTSLHRGNRYMVAVVMGGASAGSRDARMRELISQTVTVASTKRTAPMVAENGDRSQPMVAAKPEAKAEVKVAKVEAKAAAKVEAKVAAKVEPTLDAQSDGKSDGKDQQRFTVANATSTTVRLAGPPPARLTMGSSEPIRPLLVRTVSVKASTLQAASPAPAPAFVPVQAAAPAPAKIETPKTEPESEPPSIAIARIDLPQDEVATADVAKAEPAKAEPAKAEAAKADSSRVNSSKPDVSKSDSSKFASAKASPAKAEVAKTEVAKAEVAKVEVAKVVTPVAAEPSQPRQAPTLASAASRAVPVPAPAPSASRTATVVPSSTKAVVRSGWMIQVGAFQAEQEAKQRLSSIQNKASKVVDGTDPFTESVEKGGSTFYRARFAGFDKDKAEAACKMLKRDGVECVTIRN
jgi:D-alanyl-D-alanine carboxypeptidase